MSQSRRSIEAEAVRVRVEARATYLGGDRHVVQAADIVALDELLLDLLQSGLKHLKTKRLKSIDLGGPATAQALPSALLFSFLYR